MAVEDNLKSDDVSNLPSGLLIDGRWCQSGASIPVVNKFSHETFALVEGAKPDHVDAAVRAAERAVSESPLSPERRYSILRAAAEHLRARESDVLAAYVAETGFTVADARTEFARTQETFMLCAEEARRITGETVPVEASPGSEGRLAFTMRMPVGVVCAIAPFNAPLNTVAHKIGPAIAAGNGVVLKPALSTPLCSVFLCEALVEAGIPDGYLNLVVGSGTEVGEQLLQDRRIRYYTFTGSTQVGLAVKQHSGIAKTHLELGSNSATIVCADADLGHAADLIVRAGFRKAGQVCTSVQRVLVHQSVSAQLSEELAMRTERLAVGDPSLPSTDVGPMISESEAERALSWVRDAEANGAHVLTGGERERSLLTPMVVGDVPRDARLMCDEVFAPIVALTPFDTLDEAVDVANGTPYGLQAGVFTRDLDVAFHLARKLVVGGVMINDTSSYHADAMPYGGAKDSGYGLEGPRYATMDMTVPRLIVLNLREPS